MADLKKMKLEKCVFCGVSSSEQNPVIVGDAIQGSAICFECSDAIATIVASSRSLETDNNQNSCDMSEHDRIVSSISKLMKPSEMVEFLDKSIVSQQIAKKEVSMAVFEHMKRKAVFDITGESRVKKANVFLMGKSGVSKTEMVNQISKLLSVPMITIDCTSVTEAGYVGDSIDDKMKSLLDRADGDINAAQFGIVFLDEVDKLRRSSGSSQTTANVGHEGVQDALLKVIEGCEITISATSQSKASGRATHSMDTSNILFIASGAFDGIEAEIGDGGSSEIGFVKQDKSDDSLDGSDGKAYRKIRSEHLISYGFKPEFIGRFNTFVPFDELSVDDLVSILKNSSLSRVNEVIYSMRLVGCELSFDDSSFLEIAKYASKEKTGARTLGKIVDTVLRDVRYGANNGDLMKFNVTGEYVVERMEQ